MGVQNWLLAFLGPSTLLVQQATCLMIDAIVETSQTSASKYEIKRPPLDTPWTYNVAPNERWPTYPRPQLQRSNWQNLNGIWLWQDSSKKDGMQDNATSITPDTFDKQAFVPSCIAADDASDSWYYRTFVVPEAWSRQHVLLNFGAVDYNATIFINGHNIGTHQGGYDSFEIDITANVSFGQTNELLVHVVDPTDTQDDIPLGKQTRNPEHIFYTSCSGIWQSVWIEAAPASHITQLDLHGSLEGIVTVTAHTNTDVDIGANVTIFRNGHVIGGAVGQSDKQYSFGIGKPDLWSPANPVLYEVEASSGNDTVRSYMGYRTIEKHKIRGIHRPALNGQFEFQMGVLDQGYFPDGIYVAPSEEAMRYDIQILKQAGFNMLRKHIKVEPSLFYRACDELGIMVVQDMPSMPALPSPLGRIPNKAEIAEFGRQLEAIVKQHLSHPSIVTWTIYNEGWGQGNVSDNPEQALVERVRKIDPTRLIDAVSGWHDHGHGDFVSVHNYPQPLCGVVDVPGPSSGYDNKRIGFQSEFGGLGTRPAEENLWNVAKAKQHVTDTYMIYKDHKEWNERAHDILSILHDQVARNYCSAAVWTQITDVEGEVNGLMTYDRRIQRMDLGQWQNDIRAIYAAAERWEGSIWDD